MTMYKMKYLGFVVEATQKKVQRYQHDSTCLLKSHDHKGFAMLQSAR